jgi:hypothetical protein
LLCHKSLSKPLNNHNIKVSKEHLSHKAPTAHLVSTFNGFAKIHFEDQVVVVGTQQSRQADKAVGAACFVLCPQLPLALPNGFLLPEIPRATLLFLDVNDLSRRHGLNHIRDVDCSTNISL